MASSLTSNLLKKALAEGIGTFALVFFGCGVLMLAERFPGLVSMDMAPMMFGLAVATMIYAVGHISGAHFNPAVTLGFAMARHFPVKQVPIYWLAQIMGGLLALMFLRATLPNGQHFGETIPQVALIQAVIWEAVFTFFLVCCFNCNTKNCIYHTLKLKARLSFL